MTNFLATIAILGVLIAGFSSCESNGPSASYTPKTGVTLKDHNWRVDGFGLVAIATFKVKNANSYPVKDLSFRCDLYGSSGTQIGTLRETVYATINPNSSKALREVNLGFMNSQGVSLACYLTDWVEVAGYVPNPRSKAKKVQELVGATPDGKIGPATRAKMDTYCKKYGLTSCTVNALVLRTK